MVVTAGSMVFSGVARDKEFEQLVERLRPILSRAFVAAYGPERGQEALAEALAFAWERFDQVAAMGNPAGYLYRVGQSRTRPRKSVVFPKPETVGVPWVEPALPAALSALTEHQRVAVVLVHGYGWTHREVSALIGVAPTTVQNHLERGLAALRRHMEVVTDV